MDTERWNLWIIYTKTHPHPPCHWALLPWERWTPLKISIYWSLPSCTRNDSRKHWLIWNTASNLAKTWWSTAKENMPVTQANWQWSVNSDETFARTKQFGGTPGNILLSGWKRTQPPTWASLFMIFIDELVSIVTTLLLLTEDKGSRQSILRSWKISKVNWYLSIVFFPPVRRDLCPSASLEVFRSTTDSDGGWWRTTTHTDQSIRGRDPSCNRMETLEQAIDPSWTTGQSRGTETHLARTGIRATWSSLLSQWFGTHQGSTRWLRNGYSVLWAATCCQWKNPSCKSPILSGVVQQHSLGCVEVFQTDDSANDVKHRVMWRYA